MARKKSNSSEGVAAVRVLTNISVDGVDYQANQLVAFSEDVLGPLLADGLVDATVEAVAYCAEELQAEIIVHEAPVSDDIEQDDSTTEGSDQ